MPKSYAQLKAEIAKLEKEAAALRAVETNKVIAQIRESIATFGLTAEQLFGQGAKVLKAAAAGVFGGGKASRKGAGIAKYRDPKTGKTWTGFGKAPGWIAKARSRDRFLIDQSRVAAMPSSKAATSPELKKATEKKTREVLAPSKQVKRTRTGASAGAGAGANAAQAKVKTAAVKKVATTRSGPSKSSRSSAKASASKVEKPVPKAAKAIKKALAKPARSQSAAKKTSRVKTPAQSVVPSGATQSPQAPASAS